MKKLIFFASALSGLFLAASCQQESLEPEMTDNRVSYTIQVPGAIGTKVIGAKDEDIAKVNQLVYAVYHTTATEKDDHTKAETKLFQKTETITDGTAKVEFELVNNQNFRVLFWAQVAGNDVYTVDDLKNVTLEQSLAANNEDYAAFAGSDFIRYGDDISGRTVTLERPVAQLNIATAPGSLDIEGQTTVDMTTTGVTVKGLSTSYNVAQAVAGTVSETMFIYAPATLDGLSENTISVNGTVYDYVAMNYVAFAEKTGSNVEVSYTINTSNVGTISNTIRNVPVKPNYRTNIVGDLITSTSDYIVTLDATWPTDQETTVKVVSVYTAADLQQQINAIAAGVEGNIRLEGDINLDDLSILSRAESATSAPESLIIPADKILTLDLNGKTITGSKTVGKDADGRLVPMIVNNADLTIKNGNITAHNEAVNGGAAILNKGTLALENVTVTGAGSDIATGTASYAVNTEGEGSRLVVRNSNISGRGAVGATKGAKVEINGGTYHTPAVAWGHAVYATGEGTEVLINDGTFSEGYAMSADNWGMYQIYSGDKAKVTVKGGTFEPWDCANGYDLHTAGEGTIEIYGGKFAEDPSDQNGIDYVAEGYVAISPETEGGYYTIGVPVAMVGSKEYGRIEDALKAWTNNTTLTLLSDVTLNDVVAIKSTEHHILDLSTYTLTAAEGKNAFEIIATGTGDAERYAITINADADKPGSINAGNKSIVYYDFSKGTATGNDRPIIKINGGVFTGSTSSWGTSGIFFKGGSAARQAATLNISGGEFKCAIYGTGKSKLLISGGVFHYSVGSQGDQTALRLISGGTFKTLGFMTADSTNKKFWFGTSMAVSDVGLYINDDNYLVVGGPVITDFGERFEAKATNATKWSSYLQYSSAAANGLYYTNAEMAIKKHGEANVVLPE